MNHPAEKTAVQHAGGQYSLICSVLQKRHFAEYNVVCLLGELILDGAVLGPPQQELVYQIIQLCLPCSALQQLEKASWQQFDVIVRALVVVSQTAWSPLLSCFCPCTKVDASFATGLRCTTSCELNPRTGSNGQPCCTLALPCSIGNCSIASGHVTKAGATALPETSQEDHVCQCKAS